VKYQVTSKERPPKFPLVVI